MLRSVQPELLDDLPSHHPDALHCRRDLRLINAFMGNFRWVKRELRTHLQPTDRVLELGAGDGALARELGSIAPRYTGLDVCARSEKWPANSDWQQGDLRTFDRYHDYSVIVANLILHQFPDGDLATLGRLIERSARVIIACEPARKRTSQWLYGAVGPLLGANRVTRHDARVSITAGFRGHELADLLGLNPTRWHVICGAAPVGAYHLTATRRS